MDLSFKKRKILETLTWAVKSRVKVLEKPVLPKFDNFGCFFNNLDQRSTIVTQDAQTGVLEPCDHQNRPIGSDDGAVLAITK